MLCKPCAEITSFLLESRQSHSIKARILRILCFGAVRMVFEAGQSVLCYHGPQLYDAKVRTVMYCVFLSKNKQLV